MIRSTVNGTIKSVTRSVKSESYETVMVGDDAATAELGEMRDVDPRAPYQTTTPSNDHNG